MLVVSWCGGFLGEMDKAGVKAVKVEGMVGPSISKVFVWLPARLRDFVPVDVDCLWLAARAEFLSSPDAMRLCRL